MKTKNHRHSSEKNSSADECGCAPTCCDGRRTETHSDQAARQADAAGETATRELVRSAYGEIARGGSDCCGQRTAASTYNGVGESYSGIEGYVPEADLGLGCGVPTEYAGIEPGMTVLDLGSGAGNDVFVARREVGESGRVIGVDFTPGMVAKANANRVKVGYENVEFRLGEIENLPVEEGVVDVVISNCVLNLVPDKTRAFSEIFRVLRPGGYFCVSDIVIEGELPPQLRQAAELYVGCVAGAVPKDSYLEIVVSSGFTALEILKEREVVIPDEHLLEFISADELATLREARVRVVSVTLRAVKP